VHDEARLLGARAVFDKPVDLGDLTAAACAVLRGEAPEGAW
jgi:hypothetical protein